MTIETVNVIGAAMLSCHIVYGRGGLANNHAGNKRYRDIVTSFKNALDMVQVNDDEYRFVERAAPKKARTEVIQAPREKSRERQYIQDHDVLLKDSESATSGTEIYFDHVRALLSPSTDLEELVKLQDMCYQCKFFDDNNNPTATATFWITMDLALNHEEWTATSEPDNAWEVKYWKKMDSNGEVVEEVPVVRASAACIAHSLAEEEDDVENGLIASATERE